MTMTNEEWRKHPYYKFDPLAEEIQPALLNSVDIEKYIDKGCLIENIDFSSDRLKTASYEMRLLGKLYDWSTTDDGRLKPHCRDVCHGKEIVLYRNSITYLWMKESLLLPEYIAARFNLHIRYVHKEILLGTGPLVDPGFSGNLLIPLHNLTDNDYQLKGGDGVIWVEFTKMSKLEESSRPKPFPIEKYIDNPGLYFEKSGVTKAGGVQSAFKGALEKTVNAADAARKSATNAREETERFRKIYTWAGFASVVVIVIAVGSMIMGGYSLVNQVVKTTTEIHRQIESDRNEQSKNTDAVQKKIADLEARIDEYSTEMKALKGQVGLMNEDER